jgi:hypothetical protein
MEQLLLLLVCFVFVVYVLYRMHLKALVLSRSQSINYLIAPCMKQSLEQQMKRIQLAENGVHI